MGVDSAQHDIEIYKVDDYEAIDIFILHHYLSGLIVWKNSRIAVILKLSIKLVANLHLQFNKNNRLVWESLKYRTMLEQLKVKMIPK